MALELWLALFAAHWANRHGGARPVEGIVSQRLAPRSAPADARCPRTGATPPQRLRRVSARTSEMAGLWQKGIARRKRCAVKKLDSSVALGRASYERWLGTEPDEITAAADALATSNRTTLRSWTYKCGCAGPGK